jgi:predicted RNase H-like nuclease (RuvC/YqgF family)
MFKFSSIEITPSEESVGGDGEIEVVFSLQQRTNHALLVQQEDSPEAEAVRGIEGCRFSFAFTTDETQANQQNLFREEMSPLEAKLERMNQEIQQVEDEQRRIEDRIRHECSESNIEEYYWHGSQQVSQEEVSDNFTFH